MAILAGLGELFAATAQQGEYSSPGFQNQLTARQVEHHESTDKKSS